MAISGSANFDLDVAEIIEEAFERCGLEMRTGYDAVTARRSLNLMLADWANRGINLWTVRQFSQTVAQLSSTSAIDTYPIGTITATINDSSSFSIGETITGSISGTTAKIITKPSSTTLTVTVPSGAFRANEQITGSSSSAETTLSSDPSLEDVQKTIDILDMVVRRSGSDITINRISRSDYLAVPDKDDQGRATQFFVDRLITPTVTIWPVPENSTDTLIYYRLIRMDDADESTNTMEVPFRFLPCLVSGLAYCIAVKRAPARMADLKVSYEEDFFRAATEDRDRTSLQLVPTANSIQVM
jgi:hypothetical protein